MKTILVTGGCGFIGSHTCVSLLEDGYKLIVIDSNINSSPLALVRVKEILQNKNIAIEEIIFKNGDIRDVNFINNVFKEASLANNPITAVIHFAGLKSVFESVKNPSLYWDVNVVGSLCLLKVMEYYDCTTIVFSSSATIYGDDWSGSIVESTGLEPKSPYGNTKATIEKILEDFFKISGNNWRVANLRYFNPIGAHPSGMLGENPLGIPNNLFPYICRVAKGEYKNLVIYGNDWPTEDGTGVRDYIHVMDLAASHRAALDYLFNNEPQFISLNIGTGRGTSVIQLVDTFKRINNCDLPYVISKRRKGDVPTLIANNQYALSKLDWSPSKSIQDMCKDGWRWNLLNPKGFENR